MKLYTHTRTITAVCTKKKVLIICILLAVYLYLIRPSNLDYTGNNVDPGDSDYPQEFLPPEECVPYHLYDIDESSEEMPMEVFCDQKSLRSDVICRWHLSQQKNVATFYFSEKPSDDKCLLPSSVISGVNSGTAMIPKIVHYVLFGVKKLTFMNYMSFLSVKKFVRPLAIYVVGDVKPSGKWWSRVEGELEVRFIYRSKPSWLGDSLIRYDLHAQNLVALQVLLANGGIYLDPSMLILRSLHPLLKYNVTLGLLSDVTGIGEDIIIAERQSPFLAAWLIGYTAPIYNSTNKYRIVRTRPYVLWGSAHGGAKIHLETTRFYNPSMKHSDLLYTNDVDWSKNFAMKIWRKHGYRYPQDFGDIKKMDNTLGQVLRHIKRQ